MVSSLKKGQTRHGSGPFFLFLIAVLGLTLLAACQGDAVGSPAETVVLLIGEYELEVEVAADPVTRQRGLSFRRELLENGGMLFVFPADVRPIFWMRNTYQPLSIAFMDADGWILEIEDMQPLDETPYQPDRSIRYAVEVQQGWFAERNLEVGQQIILPLFELPAR